jgi:hypothetical protein
LDISGRKQQEAGENLAAGGAIILNPAPKIVPDIMNSRSRFLGNVPRRRRVNTYNVSVENVKTLSRNLT